MTIFDAPDLRTDGSGRAEWRDIRAYFDKAAAQANKPVPQRLEASGLGSWWFGEQPDRSRPDRALLRSFLLRQRLLVDLPIAIAATLLLVPLLLVLSLAIKLDSPGPVLFRQIRVGLHGRRFTILKFRTMHDDQSDHSGVRQTVPNDRRVTRLGRILRLTNLDELPQLWNVLKGDMSLVGPRPMVPGQLIGKRPAADLISGYRYRTWVRPGVTGWAQANGYRGPTGTEEAGRMRFLHDVAYVQNASCRLDLYTILLTIVRQARRPDGV